MRRSVVALVQADGRLVEHVEHAHEARADLAGQTDALGLAARQRGRRAVQREVVEAHVEQEAERALISLRTRSAIDAVSLGELSREGVGRVGDRDMDDSSWMLRPSIGDGEREAA
jgi:hypothetical protein